MIGPSFGAGLAAADRGRAERFEAGLGHPPADVAVEDEGGAEVAGAVIAAAVGGLERLRVGAGGVGLEVALGPGCASAAGGDRRRRRAAETRRVTSGVEGLMLETYPGSVLQTERRPVRGGEGERRPVDGGGDPLGGRGRALEDRPDQGLGVGLGAERQRGGARRAAAPGSAPARCGRRPGSRRGRPARRPRQKAPKRETKTSTSSKPAPPSSTSKRARSRPRR